MARPQIADQQQRAPMWNINAQHPEEDVITRAASVIRGGGLIVYPTETFYGLGAHPLIEAALERIYRIKGRDFAKPLPLIAADEGTVRRAVAEWPRAAERLARAFWPGPLTLILSAAPHLPPLVHAHTGTIAVRISSHPAARRLSAAAGGLLVATSANASGDPAHTMVKDMSAALLAGVDGVLDAGTLPGQLPSTLVDVSSQTPRLVRSGCVPWAEVQRVLEL